MLMRGTVPIGTHTRTADLHDSLAELGGRLIVQALAQLAHGPLTGQPQPLEGVSYAHKIDKTEAPIDWARPALQIDRRVRAFDPFPGACTTYQGEVIKVWQAECGTTDRPEVAPGTVVSLGPQGLGVACGQGLLHLTVLQRAGGKRLPVAEFLRGCPVQVGERLGVDGA
jgi:methionyl-tRNA formyltransferase